MKQKLIENEGIPGYLLLILAVISGLAVANLYYNQPLLNEICSDLKVNEFTANLIPMVTQIGYACGLLFIIPLGDLYNRRRIIVVNFTLLSLSMASIALSGNIGLVLASSLITGICSVMPQIFIPIASQFSKPEHKSKNVGVLVSGLLTGILGSRVISGLVGEYWGWRTMYYVAAVIMFVCIFVVIKVIPDMTINYKGTYKELMQSLLGIFRQRPDIRLSSLRAGLCFGSFLCLWACLAFKLSGAPFYAGNNIIGLMGLCGVAGALTASIVGRYVRILGVKRLNYIGCSVIIVSWAIMFFFQNTYTGFIVGIMLMDVGMQCVQLSNQTYVLTSVPNASNRVNTIFMTAYFIGGALGTFLAGFFWHYLQWTGVVIVGISLTMVSLLITRFAKVLQ